MKNYATLTLKQGRESSLKRFHPWIFSGAVGRLDEGTESGDPVRVVAADGTPLAVGFWEGGSIAARIMSFSDREIDSNLFRERLSAAWQLRGQLGLVGNSKTTAFRLVHGDGDGIPGLIIDWYDGHAVLQAHSYGIYLQAPLMAEVLKDVTGGQLKQLFDKSGNCLGGRNLPSIENRYLYSAEVTRDECEILEDGRRFLVNWEAGQKTGFFLDQRENRMQLAHLAAGRRVLNAFSYSGGFSVYALTGGAKKVVSVDSSSHAIEMVERNLEANGLTENHESLKAEVQPVLKERASEFDLIILDPPAFAKHKSARHQAVQGYKRLNQAAMERMPSQSMLMTFSCSQVVGGDLFEGAVRAAAIEAGRAVRVLARLSQPADHPVNIFQPEGEYLKGLLLYIL